MKAIVYILAVLGFVSVMLTLAGGALIWSYTQAEDPTKGTKRGA